MQSRLGVSQAACFPSRLSDQPPIARKTGFLAGCKLQNLASGAARNAQSRVDVLNKRGKLRLLNFSLGRVARGVPLGLPNVNVTLYNEHFLTLEYDSMV